MPDLPGLERCRELRFFTPGELGRRIGFSAAAIRAIENGERRVWPTTAERLAEVLNVSLDELTQRVPPTSSVVPYDKIDFSYHANLRMQERSIPKQVILDVLNAPDQTYRDKGELVSERVLSDGKPWRVVYVKDPRPNRSAILIVSVYRITRLKAL